VGASRCAVTPTDTTIAATLQTLQIAPLGANAPSGPWNAATGSGGMVIPLPLKNGDQIVGLRARLLDAPGMTFTLSLQSVVDGVANTLSTGAPSSGAAAKQTLSVPGLAVTVASGTNYQVAISRATGSGLAQIYWIEVDSVTQ
jgi:hypothetical protein